MLSKGEWGRYFVMRITITIRYLDKLTLLPMALLMAMSPLPCLTTATPERQSGTLHQSEVSMWSRDPGQPITAHLEAASVAVTDTRVAQQTRV